MEFHDGNTKNSDDKDFDGMKEQHILNEIHNSTRSSAFDWTHLGD